MLRSIKTWLSLNIETYVGWVEKHITIYAYKNDAKLWKNLSTIPKNNMPSSVFPDPPVLFIIDGGITEMFSLHTRTKTITCMFEPNVNVYQNNCVIRQATPEKNVYGSFKGTLNYPVELVLSISDKISIKGFWIDDVFHITALSNYPIH